MGNQRFIDEVYGLTRPLAINSMDEASETIAKALRERTNGQDDNDKFARHLAWIIGFDTLINDRKRLRDLSSFMTSAEA